MVGLAGSSVSSDCDSGMVVLVFEEVIRGIMPSHILKCKMYAMSDCGRAGILIFTQLWKKLEKI